MLIITIFSSAILYIGEHNHIFQKNDLKGLSSRVLSRFVISPYQVLSLVFMLIYFFQLKKNIFTNIFINLLHRVNFNKKIIKKIFSITYLISFFLVVFIMSKLLIKDISKFQKRLEKRSITTYKFYNSNNVDTECWRRIGFWRKMPENVCYEIVDSYLLIKNKDKKISFFKSNSTTDTYLLYKN